MGLRGVDDEGGGVMKMVGGGGVSLFVLSPLPFALLSTLASTEVRPVALLGPAPGRRPQTQPNLPQPLASLFSSRGTLGADGPSPQQGRWVAGAGKGSD